MFCRSLICSEDISSLQSSNKSFFFFVITPAVTLTGQNCQHCQELWTMDDSNSTPKYCQESQTMDNPASTSHHCQESQTMDEPTSLPKSVRSHRLWTTQPPLPHHSQQLCIMDDPVSLPQHCWQSWTMDGQACIIPGSTCNFTP